MSDLLDFPLPVKSSEPQGLLKRLSARHHRLAQALAEGIPPGEAALLCGYVASRVSILQNDKAFRELVAFYSTKRAEQFIETGRQLSEVASTALGILQDRLEEKPDDFSSSQLLSIAATAADRSGFGPSSTQRVVSVTVGAAELAELKQQVQRTQPNLVRVISSQHESDSGSAEAQPSANAPAEAGPGAEGPEV